MGEQFKVKRGVSFNLTRLLKKTRDRSTKSHETTPNYILSDIGFRVVSCDLVD